MSDNYLRYIPIEPGFCPANPAAEAAANMLRRLLPAADEVQTRLTSPVRFVDAGANWEGVTCPACGADAQSWWSDAMSEAAETQFESLEVRAGCCGAVVSLNDLHYRWPVGFARFVLEAMNPGERGLSEDQLDSLGAQLGCRVREIKAHA
jgi:hypothetical protein